MARDDWRLRIDLPEEHAGGLLERLGVVRSDADELAGELKDSRLAVTQDEGVMFVYASTSLELEQAKPVIDRELAELGATGTISTEHWLVAEDRWDDDPPAPNEDKAVLAGGHAPWEVRIPCATHQVAEELADRLETEGYGVVRRWKYVIAGCASREQAQELATRLHGEVEVGGEVVWEAAPPFATFSPF